MSKTYRIQKEKDPSDIPHYRRLPREVKRVNTDLGVTPLETVNILDTVPWPHPEIEFYKKSLLGNYDLTTWKVPRGKDVSLYREIYRLKECLLWWWNLPIHNKIGTPYGILMENLTHGPAYADELADAIKYSMRLSASCALVYGKDLYPTTCTDIEDEDQFFSPFHLIPFERPYSNDIDLLLKEPTPIPENILKRFKEKVLEFIKVPLENKRVLDDMDQLEMMGSVSAFDPNSNRRLPKVISRLLQKGEKRTTSSFIFDYVKVDKAPHESRDCVVPSAETAASLRLLRLQLHQVLRVPGDVIWDKDFSWVPDWLSLNQKKLFIMSDQRKCGLTFPLQLLKELFLTLEEVFPSWDFGLIRGYDHAYIKLDKRGLHQIRGGPGLGQLTEAISACVAILFEMFKEDYPDKQLEGRFFGDDQVIRLFYDDLREEPIQDWVIEMAQAWDVFMEAHGLQIHKRKPFISAGGVFLEIYGEDFPITVTKKCQWVGHFFKTLCQGNIALAKDYFASMYDNIFEEERGYGENILFQTLLPFWGYEFYPQEVYLPFQLGGWFRRRSEEGLDLLFTQFDKIPDRFRGLTNLLEVKRDLPHGGTKVAKEFSSLLSRVRKGFRSQSDQKPTAWNYTKLAELGVDSIRPSLKEYVNSNQIWINKRQKAFKRKPKPWGQIFNKYWEMTIDEGKAYAPPLSVYHEGINWVPFGTPVESEKTDASTEDSRRSFFKLCQEVGTLLPQYEFWTKNTYSGLAFCMYAFIKSLHITKFIITPRIINTIMIMGESNLEKILLYGLKTYGRIIFPKLDKWIPEIRDAFEGRLDNIIYLDHAGWIAYPTRIPYDMEPELFRIQSEMVGELTEALLPQSIEKDFLIPFCDREGLIKSISPPKSLREIHISQMESSNPVEVPAEEEKALLMALVHQVYAPSHQFVEEEVVRQDLWDQIYDPGTGGEDIFENEDDLLIGFGD